MTPDHLLALESEAAAVVDVLRRGDPGAPVPTCPGWVLRDLAAHLGRVHRWGAAVVRTGERQPQDGSAPADDGLADWLAEGAAALVATLREAGPDRSCWTLSGPGTAAFWARRMALETLVHRVDAEAAVGATSPVDPALAEDGIAEVLEVMLPRQVALGRAPEPDTGVALVTGQTRRLGTAPPSATVAGPAEAVLLLLWRRGTADDPRLTVSGDRAALDALLSLALTP